MQHGPTQLSTITHTNEAQKFARASQSDLPEGTQSDLPTHTHDAKQKGVGARRGQPTKAAARVLCLRRLFLARAAQVMLLGKTVLCLRPPRFFIVSSCS